MASDRESDPLGKLSGSIADGRSIDWDAVRALAADDDELRRLLDHLRIVAAVADVHRSQAAETLATSVAQNATTRSGEVEAARRWGHLLLVRKIGEGAFGEVYEALDTWLDHPRALKLLKPDAARHASPSQLLHEARKLVRVRHPNVVMVHGADSHDGRVGFWMDLIEGQTLERLLGEGRLSAGEATHIGRELCDALAAVHAAKLVHRDIKAQNVMRANDGGRIILMDFGAGEFLDVPSDRRPQGTPLYLAPELFTGGAATVRSDIYSLGVLLYYLVTGHFPVEGRSFTDLALAHAQRMRRRLRDVRPDLPGPFIQVVERAIDPEPMRRYESAGDFHAALDAQGPQRPRRDEGPSSVTPHARAKERLVPAVAVGLGTVALILTMGFLACRMFEVAMQVTSEFGFGLVDYFEVGAKALLPFAIYFGVMAAFVPMLAGVGRLARPLYARWNRHAAWAQRLAPETIATLIPLVAGFVGGGIFWLHRSLFTAMADLQSGTGAKTRILDNTFKETYLGFSNWAALLCVSLVLAAWRYWPALEHRANDLPTVRRMKWVAVGVALFLAASAIAPRHLVFGRFDVVLFENRRSLVIGTNGEELLLYAADATGVYRFQVPKNSIKSTDVPRKRLVDDP